MKYIRHNNNNNNNNNNSNNDDNNNNKITSIREVLILKLIAPSRHQN